jgi:serine/threonine protein kinase
MIAKAKIECQVDLEDVLHEVQIMHHLSMGACDHIVKLYDVYEDRESVYLLLEICTGGAPRRHGARAGARGAAPDSAAEHGPIAARRGPVAG